MSTLLTEKNSAWEHLITFAWKQVLCNATPIPQNKYQNHSSKQPKFYIWAASWQNQQNDCAPSENYDQPQWMPNLIRVFALHSVGSSGPKLSSCGQRRLIRLGRCPGWSESSLGAHSFCCFYHVVAHFISVSCFSIPKRLGNDSISYRLRNHSIS